MTKQEMVSQIWDRRTVSRLAQDFARIAAAELTRTTVPVRDPSFLPKVKRLIRKPGRAQDIVPIVKKLVESSLHLCHPRYASHQVVAPIPLAALVESVIASLNNGVAIWDMSP